MIGRCKFEAWLDDTNDAAQYIERGNMATTRQDWITTARQKAIDAIREGRTADALKGVDEIWAEGRPIHDFYGDMCATFCDFIAEELDEGAVERAWRFIGERLWKPVFMEVAKDGAVAVAGLYAMFLRSHGYQFRIEEDDEKIVFLLDYCPSGQRLMMEGKIKGDRRHPLDHGVSSKPYPWTFGRTGVPYYCAHTELWFTTMPAEWGIPIMSTEFGQFDSEGHVIGTPCTTTFWKNR